MQIISFIVFQFNDALRNMDCALENNALKCIRCCSKTAFRSQKTVYNTFPELDRMLNIKPQDSFFQNSITIIFFVSGVGIRARIANAIETNSQQLYKFI